MSPEAVASTVKAFQTIIDTLEDAKARAQLAFLASPVVFFCCHGVSYTSYIAQVNEAQQSCREAIRAVIAASESKEQIEAPIGA